MKDEIKNNKRKYLFTSVFILLSFFFSIILVELILRFTPYDNLRITDYSDPFSVALRYYFEADEELGYDISKNKTGFFYTVEGIRFPVWSNELGCFDKPYQGEKEPIVLVGDSFTWGFVPFEKTIGSTIEDTIQKRVIKCGVGGYGTKKEMIKAKRVIQKIQAKPSLIIVGYLMRNDLTDDWLFPGVTVIDGFLVGKIKLKNLETGEKEIISDEEIIREVKKATIEVEEHKRKYESIISKIKAWLTKNSIIYNIIRNNEFLRKIAASLNLVEKKSDKAAPEERENIEQNKNQDANLNLLHLLPFIQQHKYEWLNQAWNQHIQNIIEFNDYAKQIGSKLLVVMIPSKEQVYKQLRPKIDHIDFYLPNRILADVFRKHNILYIDLTQDFEKYSAAQKSLSLGAKKGLYYKNNGHWNQNGSYIAGLLVSKYIIENNTINVENRESVLQNIEKELIRMQKVLESE